MSRKPSADPQLVRLQHLLDCHGADPEHWPQNERSWAEQLIAGNAGAAALQAEAEGLEYLLDQVPGIEPSTALQRAVAEIPLRHPAAEWAEPAPGWRSLWPFATLWRPLLAAALVAALGVLSGMATLESPSMSETDEYWSDLSGLAFAVDLDEELEP